MNTTELKFNGKVLPIKLGIYVIERFAAGGISWDKIPLEYKTNIPETTKKILYYGAINATKGKNPDSVEMDDIYDAIDEHGMLSPVISDIVKKFFETYTKGVPQTQLDEMEKQQGKLEAKTKPKKK